MSYKANIHSFRCGEKYYFYDVNKNAIVKISKEAYVFLNSKRGSEIAQNQELGNLLRKGYLSDNRPEIIVHPCNDIVEELLSRNLSKICLQVTQQCNFRCDYCVYSGQYNNRSHSLKKMNWETARKAIDFLVQNSSCNETIDIGFYGGEPLLEYDFIKKCMSYAREKAEGKNLTFSITTNGSLLTYEIAERFLQDNVNVVVSIDGPKEVQNRQRKLLNGEGSFDTVYYNVKGILDRYPKFKNLLSFNMVIDQRYELKPIIDFVSDNNSIASLIEISAQTVAEDGINKPIEYNSQFIEQWKYGEFRYLLFLLKRLSKKNKDIRIWEDEYLKTKIFIKESRNTIRPLQKCDHHGGPCIPGQLRLFIDVDGTFFPCERVSESTVDMMIGNVDSGFNFDRVRKLLNIGKMTEKECRECFAFRNCNICATAIDDNGILSREKKKIACLESRSLFDEMLKTVAALYQCGYSIEI